MKHNRNTNYLIIAFIAALICLLVLVTIAKAAWVVKWDVITTTLISCPQPAVVTDAYGRMPNSTTQTLQSCTTINRRSKERAFETLSGAGEFVKRGRESVANMWPPELQNFTITEVVK